MAQTTILKTIEGSKRKVRKKKKGIILGLGSFKFCLEIFNIFIFSLLHFINISVLYFSSFCLRVCIWKQTQVCFPVQMRLFLIWYCFSTPPPPPPPSPALLLSSFHNQTYKWSYICCFSSTEVLKHTLGSAHVTP